MECNHMTEEGYPAVSFDNNSNTIRCTICNQEIELNTYQIRKLIQESVSLEDKAIIITFTNKERYIYQKPLCEMTYHDDIYLDGDIVETVDGRMFKNFNIAIIIKRKNITNKVSKIEVIIKRGKDNKDTIDSAVILDYLSPEVLQLII